MSSRSRPGRDAFHGDVAAMREDPLRARAAQWDADAHDCFRIVTADEFDYDITLHAVGAFVWGRAAGDVRYWRARGAGGSFAVLRFSEPDMLDVVYTGHLTGVLYLDKRKDVDIYAEVMNHLSTQRPDPRPNPGASWLRTSGRPRVISWYHPGGSPGRQQTRDQPSPIPQTATR